ncbi:hypothetical protein [Carboxylicivirga sp. RSCT41]|uniref:hypothetical protein n=1 Tax=Carboxylicivirga agarovorans TaxID=3417570 RepID=UPI003D342230
MKRVILISAVLISLGLSSNAQELGVRFGDVSGGNVAIDGIFSTGQFSRIHGDVSFGNGVGIDLLWDFLYKPLGNEAFSWYVGVGPYTRIDDPFKLGVVGEIGLEYLFSGVPLALGIDYRPAFEIIDNTDFHAGGFGLNVRWRFGVSKE